MCLTRTLTSEHSTINTPHPALESPNQASTKDLLGIFLCFSIDMIALAPGGRCCCNNYDVHYRVPISARRQNSKSAGEKKNREILVLTSAKANGKICQEVNTRRIQV